MKPVLRNGVWLTIVATLILGWLFDATRMRIENAFVTQELRYCNETITGLQRVIEAKGLRWDTRQPGYQLIETEATRRGD